MKNRTILLLTITFGLFSCTSQKKLTTELPFEVGQATTQVWKGGMEASGSGNILKIPVSKNVVVNTCYFRGAVTDAAIVKEGKQFYVVAKFTNKRSVKPDIIMHADGRKEVGNQPPALNTNTSDEIPFQLQADEAVLGFISGTTQQYVKIENIKELAPLLYSSKPRN